MSTYHLPEPISGSIGGVDFRFDAGDIEPADEAEAAALSYLVTNGHITAEPAPTRRSKSKE